MGGCCHTGQAVLTSSNSIMFEGEMWHTYGMIEHIQFGRKLDHALYNQYQSAFHTNLKSIISHDDINLRRLKDKIQDGVAYTDIRKILKKLFDLQLKSEDSIKQEEYVRLAKQTFGSRIPEVITQVPNYGHEPGNFYLSRTALQACKRILNVVQVANPKVKYCPMLPALVQILLWFISESTAFSVANQLIQKSEEASELNSATFTLNQTSFDAFLGTLVEWYKNKRDDFRDDQLKEFFSDFLKNIGHNYIPLEYYSAVIALYIVEGLGFIGRFAIGWLLVAGAAASTPKGIVLKGIAYQSILNQALKWKLPLRQMAQHSTQHEPYFFPRIVENWAVADQEILATLFCKVLPSNLNCTDIEIKHSTLQRGKEFRAHSLSSTMKKNTLMLLQTETNWIFGFYLQAGFDSDKRAQSKHASIFQLKPDYKLFHKDPNIPLINKHQTHSVHGHFTIGHNIEEQNSGLVIEQNGSRGTYVPTNVFHYGEIVSPEFRIQAFDLLILKTE